MIVLYWFVTVILLFVANYCHRIDASKDDGFLGRLVNDSQYGPNCFMKQIDVDDIPRLCMFALRNLLPGEELRYSYGEGHYPWRAVSSGKSDNQVNKDFLFWLQFWR